MREYPSLTQSPPSTNLIVILPTVSISISPPLLFHRYYRPYRGTVRGTRLGVLPDVYPAIPSFPHSPLPDYSSLIFHISPLPLLIFDTLYSILAHPASWRTNSEPNLESGANIDCCKLYRDNKAVSTVSALPAFDSWPVFRFSSFF